MTLLEHLRRWHPPDLGWLEFAKHLEPVRYKGDVEVALHVKNGNFCIESIFHDCAVEFESNGAISAVETQPKATTFTQGIAFLAHPGIHSVGPTTVMTADEGLGCFLSLRAPAPASGMERTILLSLLAHRPSDWVLYDFVYQEQADAPDKDSPWAAIELSGGELPGIDILKDSSPSLVEKYLCPIMREEYGLGAEVQALFDGVDDDGEVSELAEGRLINVTDWAQKAAAVLSLLAWQTTEISKRIRPFLREHQRAVSKSGRARRLRWNWGVCAPEDE